MFKLLLIQYLNLGKPGSRTFKHVRLVICYLDSSSDCLYVLFRLAVLYDIRQEVFFPQAQKLDGKLVSSQSTLYLFSHTVF